MSAQPHCPACDLCDAQAEVRVEDTGELLCERCFGSKYGKPQAKPDPKPADVPKTRAAAKLKDGAAYHLDGCRGFMQITHEAFDLLANHPHADFRVYVAIVAGANWRTGRCDSSREQLAKRARVGSASIPRAIKRLAASGLIVTEHKRGFNGHNVYTVQPPQKFMTPAQQDFEDVSR